MNAGHSGTSYDDYCHERDSLKHKDFEAMVPTSNIEYVSYNLLNRIFMDDQDQHGMVTAIVGGGNTYKRFLAIGSAYSAAVHDKDTLIILLNKEKQLIQKRMSCPARMSCKSHKEYCANCYRRFHLMNIYPEYITADEFMYMLNQHIKLSYGDGRYTKRIILDGLQTLDFSFPLLKKDVMFLPSIMHLCREKNISLYIICDKKAGSRDELVSMADNVVYTGKNEYGKPRIYISRCSGHYNPPSKLYCGEIKHISQMFECKEQFREADGTRTKELELSFNPLQIKEKDTADTSWQKEFPL